MSKKIAKDRTAITAEGTAIIEQPGGQFQRIALTEIDSSPFNYRKLFPPAQLQELAASIALHDVIENLTVRLVPSGRYELVTGERRFRAAALAGLTSVPCMIHIYTDEQVRQIQLSENLHRENPTPLEEAEALQALLNDHKSIDVVASKVGKSKTYIYSRLKLLSLIPAIQEMLMAGKFTIQESVLIASLVAASRGTVFC
ncbi:ParB/RepB/Spo0J family partition protein [Puia sp. P3]|uniref:ParB/RepB/Spo0J family partition protein n=1 Tax=Puia sp. P3 TaxID=3423952 RepID=UPI003D67B666